MVLKSFNLVLKGYWRSMENVFWKYVGTLNGDSLYVVVSVLWTIYIMFCWEEIELFNNNVFCGSKESVWSCVDEGNGMDNEKERFTRDNGKKTVSLCGAMMRVRVGTELSEDFHVKVGSISVVSIGVHHQLWCMKSQQVLEKVCRKKSHMRMTWFWWVKP